MKRTKAFLIVTFVVTILLAAGLAGAQSVPAVAVDDVRWDSLGKDENTSMPLGNGDMAVNVWTGQNGDIVLLMAKGDAWSENGQLLKLGRVRISLTPNPFVGAVGFTQTLRLEDASIELRAGKNLVRIWVDANHPVIRVGVSTAKAVSCRAVAEIWRNRRYHFDQHAVNQAEFGFWESKSNPAGLDFYPDTILAVDHGLGWCHYDPTSLYPTVFTREHLGSLLSKYPDPILHRCFGVIAQGKDLVRRDDTTLVSGKPAKAQELSFYATMEAP